MRFKVVASGAKKGVAVRERLGGGKGNTRRGLQDKEKSRDSRGEGAPARGRRVGDEDEECR